MDVSLNALTYSPNFWILAFVAMVVVLASIFVGFFLLWQQERPTPADVRKLEGEIQYLTDENARLRRLLAQWESVTKGHIKRLRHELGQQ